MEPNKEKEESNIYELETKDNIIEVLKKVPAKKMKLRRNIFNLSMEKGDLISINKTIESDEMIKIRNEKIEVQEEVKVNKQGWTMEQKKNYKPTYQPVKKEKFTSDIFREVEQRNRLMNRADYQANRKRADEFDKTIKSNEITLKYLTDILRSAEALVHAAK